MSRPYLQFPLLVVAAALTACGGDRADEPAAAAESAPAAPSTLPRTPAPAEAKLFFITPADGETVSNPVVVEFGLDGMSVVRAGVDEPASGHHHLIIDAGLPDLSMPIPASENYVHFGDASTATELTLAPGSHTLQLLLGDHLHVPHDPPVVSDVITITVE